MRIKTTRALPNFLELFGTIIERFGLGGAIVVAVVAEFEIHATTEQHHELIDKFLGHGTGTFWTVAVSGLLFVAVSLAQRSHYRKSAVILQKRIDELVEEKTRLHEALIGRSLRHAADLEGPIKTPPPAKPKKHAKPK
jgi:hypothetical protein